MLYRFSSVQLEQNYIRNIIVYVPLRKLICFIVCLHVGTISVIETNYGPNELVVNNFFNLYLLKWLKLFSFLLYDMSISVSFCFLLLPEKFNT